MAANVVYEVLDSRDRDNLEASITSVNNKLYEKESGLKNSINTLNTNYAALKSYAESNINELKTDKISHGEIVNEVDSTTATSDAARNVPLSAAFGGVLFNRDAFLQSQINDTNDRIDIIADSDDETLDQLSEIVAYIKNNKSLIDGVTTSKVNVSDIVDNWYSTDTDKPLSANQGNELRLQIISTMSTHNNVVHGALDTTIEGIQTDVANLQTNKVNYSDIVDDWANVGDNKPLSSNLGDALRLSIATTMSNHNNNIHTPLNTRIDGIETNVTNLTTEVGTKIPKAYIVDNLTTSDTTKVLSANQGVELKRLYDSIPSWSLASTKPTYTYTEVGADASGTASNAVSAHNTDTDAHRDIRQAIESTNEAITHRISTAAILDDLDSTIDRTGKVLSAGQGDMLYGLIKDLITRVEALEGGSTATE